MVRLPQSALLLTLSLMVTLAATPTAAADPVLKLYDLRDLIGLITPPPRAGEPPAPSQRSLSDSVVLNAMASAVKTKISTEREARRRGRVLSAMAAAAETQDPVEQLMDQLFTAISPISTIRLLPGVYAIEAEEPAHAQLHELLDEIRSLYAERYEVEIVWFRVPADHTPSVGGEVTTEEPVHRHDVVVVRRTPTPLVSVTRRSYISGLQPVVAQGAVGYAPETAVREQGLRLSVIVGAGREDAKSTLIAITGNIRQVAMGKTSGPLTRDTPNLQVELPEVRIHSIQSHLRVPLGKLTVLSVVDGFEEGESIVLAASVRKVED